MEKMGSFDWLRATLPVASTYVQTIERLKVIFGEARWEESRGALAQYTHGQESERASLSWHPDRAEYGVLVQMTGQQCATSHLNGILPFRVAQTLLDMGANFTRVDYAFDLTDTGGVPSDIYKAWARGEVKTKARTVTIVQSAQGDGSLKGETVYFGSRTSEKLLRIYDKAAQTRVDRDWIRVEIELKGANANMFIAETARHGSVRTGASYIRSALQETSVEWFESIFDGRNAPFDVAKLGRKETKFEAWFWKTVLPAVDKAIRIGLPGAEKAIQRALEQERHGPKLT